MELRGGRSSRFPAKILSTVASSRGILSFSRGLLPATNFSVLLNKMSLQKMLHPANCIHLANNHFSFNICYLLLPAGFEGYRQLAPDIGNADRQLPSKLITTLLLWQTEATLHSFTAVSDNQQTSNVGPYFLPLHSRGNSRIPPYTSPHLCHHNENE